MGKNVAAWGALVVFILLGAMFRALPSEESLSPEDGRRKAVLLFEGEPGILPGVSVRSGDEAYREEVSGNGEEGMPSRRARPSGKRPEKNGRDLDSLRQGVRARKGNPGDMKEYLDEAERIRRERVRKTLEEIRRRVREYEPSVFDPTW